MKRNNYLSWDEYFMGVAKLSALRSKDPGTQVGCCIATSDNRIASLGYNGLPRGCSDDDFP
jgi:dCMP deaminase